MTARGGERGTALELSPDQPVPARPRAPGLIVINERIMERETMTKTLRLGTAVAAALLLTLAACSSDDGAKVRSTGSGSASGSATGLSGSDLGDKGADDPLLAAAVDGYTVYVQEQIDDTVAKTTVFTDAVRAGDVEAAKAAYAPSRQGWEAIEPIAGLIEEIDGLVDSRVDDFENEDDPEFTGWHRIEYLLWDEDDAAGAVVFADQLDSDLQTLNTEIGDVEITPLAMARGAAELVEEVSEGKITGEEDRYSGTDLWDFAANIAGAEKVIELLTPALNAADPVLLAKIRVHFIAVNDGLAPYANADGTYKPYSDLTDADKTALTASLAALSESLAEVPGTLGLE